MKQRGPGTKKFSGKRYERVGMSPATKKGLPKLRNWAQFQRDVNNNSVRIVPVGSGYEAYMRKRKQKPRLSR